MIYLNGISLDPNPRALIIKCTDGILNSKGVRTSNQTRTSNKVYVELHIDERVNDQVINQSTVKLWGNTKKSGELTWGLASPAEVQHALDGGARPFGWFKDLFDRVAAHQRHEFIAGPDSLLYEHLDTIVSGFTPTLDFGAFHTKIVEPYLDANGFEHNTFTSFLFPWDATSDEKIAKAFSYVGKTVVENVPVV